MDVACVLSATITLTQVEKVSCGLRDTELIIFKREGCHLKNQYEIHGDVVSIKLNSDKYGDKETFISVNKLHKVLAFSGTWYLQYKYGYFYAVGKIQIGVKKQKNIFLHRFINDPSGDEVVDHTNHNTLDNTDENLRNVSFAENQQNRSMKKTNTSGYRGVMWNKQSDKWMGRLKLRGKLIHVGLFENAEDANKAVVKARMEYMPFSRET